KSGLHPGLLSPLPESATNPNLLQRIQHKGQGNGCQGLGPRILHLEIRKANPLVVSRPQDHFCRDTPKGARNDKQYRMRQPGVAKIRLHKAILSLTFTAIDRTPEHDKRTDPCTKYSPSFWAVAAAAGFFPSPCCAASRRCPSPASIVSSISPSPTASIAGSIAFLCSRSFCRSACTGTLPTPTSLTRSAAVLSRCWPPSKPTRRPIGTRAPPTPSAKTSVTSMRTAAATCSFSPATRF